MKNFRFPVGRCALQLSQRRQCGSALVEYTIVVLFLVIVLVAVDGNVIRDLVDKVREAYTSFVYALSISWA